MSRFPLLPLVLLVPLSSLHAVGGGRGNPGTASPSPEPPPLNKPLTAAELKSPIKAIFLRVIQARLFHGGAWTLADPSQTPVTAGRTIASLHPSLVTGLLRINDRGMPGNAEVEAFDTVRNAVRSSEKGCRFDVVIEMDNERSGASFVRRMKEISSRIHPDAWTFYVSPESTSVSPEAFEDGIAHAHSQGQMVGYDGPLSLIPQGVDYIIVRAWGLQVNREELEIVRSRRLPVLVALPTSFGSKPQPDASAYTGEMTGNEKTELLTRLASQQSSLGYRLAYPVYYPLDPSRHAHDATKDPILMVTIRSLMARFN